MYLLNVFNDFFPQYSLKTNKQKTKPFEASQYVNLHFTAGDYGTILKQTLMQPVSYIYKNNAKFSPNNWPQLAPTVR